MASQDVVKRIAEIILSELINVDRNIRVSSPGLMDVFAYPSHEMTEGNSGEHTLVRIQTSVYIELMALKKNPFIAYAKAKINGEDKTYFFTRHAASSEIKSNSKDVLFANYKSPMGRVVELNVGDDDTIHVPSGEKEVLLIEKNLFRSVKQNDQWDGINNTIYTDIDVFTIPSLQEFLNELIAIITDIKKDITKDVLELEIAIREKTEEKFREVSGLQRQVIEKMELRDQPVLDAEQGAIFRLPLSSQIIITGAPGTGKTTTLIKRIAQKSNPENLEPDEVSRIPTGHLDDYIHSDNWVMFTPTELLKIFIKEALSKESIPASDRRVKVWEDERDKIARELLGILNAGDKGYFKKTRESLFLNINNAWFIDYFRLFKEFSAEYFFELFKEATITLNNNKTAGKLITNFNKIKALLQQKNIQNVDDKAIFLIDELFRCRQLFNEINKQVKDDIEVHVLNLLQSLSNSIDDLYEIIDKSRLETSEIIELDEEFPEEEEEIEIKTDEKLIIVKQQISKTLRFLALRKAQKQSLPNRSIHTQLFKLIHPYLPEDNDIIILGKRVIDIAVSNVLTRGYSNLLNRIPFYYQRFRIKQIKENPLWFTNKFEQSVKEKRINGEEIDLLIFTILQNARKIFGRNSNLLNAHSKNDFLENIKGNYYTQVVVDEATDFSSIQLGCMYNLSSPLFNAVSFSGDLMQRVTNSGLSNWDECEVISPAIDIYTITKVYRQSPKLLNIAKILYENNVGMKAPFESAYPERSKEPDPLKFDKFSNSNFGKWVSDRILEIYRIHGGKLPSTAIFVSTDEQIPEAINSIEESLEDYSISLKGCPRGEILGSEGKVRIFSIKYIKGLEFESVFFLNINDIALHHPELFDKYIYVGLTRAASFMGVTYERRFPNKLNNIEDCFLDSTWEHLANTR